MAKTKVAENQIRRILDVIKAEPLTAKEISARLYLDAASVYRFISRLTKEQPRRLRVAGWCEASGRSPAARYLAGSGRNVPYIRKRKREKVNLRIAEGERTRAFVLALLAMPQTAKQLSARAGLAPSTVTRVLQEYRQAKRAYISAWIVLAGQRTHIPVYAAGSLPDKPRIRTTKQPAQHHFARPINRTGWAAALGV